MDKANYVPVNIPRSILRDIGPPPKSAFRETWYSSYCTSLLSSYRSMTVRFPCSVAKEKPNRQAKEPQKKSGAIPVLESH
jgi:hypothetical protein